MIQDNRARLAQSKYSLTEWRELSGEEKGLIQALYSYENMLEFVNRFHTSLKREKDKAFKDVSKSID